MCGAYYVCASASPTGHGFCSNTSCKRSHKNKEEAHESRKGRRQARWGYEDDGEEEQWEKWRPPPDDDAEERHNEPGQGSSGAAEGWPQQDEGRAAPTTPPDALQSMQPPWNRKLSDEELEVINRAAHEAVDREKKWAEEFHKKAEQKRLRSPSIEHSGWADMGKKEAAWRADTGIENPPGLLQPLPPLMKEPYPPAPPAAPPQLVLKFKAAPMLPAGWHRPMGLNAMGTVMAKAYPAHPAGAFKPAGLQLPTIPVTPARKTPAIQWRRCRP